MSTLKEELKKEMEDYKRKRELREWVKDLRRAIIYHAFLIIIMYLMYEFKLEATFNLIDLDIFDIAFLYIIVRTLLS